MDQNNSSNDQSEDSSTSPRVGQRRKNCKIRANKYTAPLYPENIRLPIRLLAINDPSTEIKFNYHRDSINPTPKEFTFGEKDTKIFDFTRNTKLREELLFLTDQYSRVVGLNVLNQLISQKDKKIGTKIFFEIPISLMTLVVKEIESGKVRNEDKRSQILRQAKQKIGKLRNLRNKEKICGKFYKIQGEMVKK